MTSNRDEPAWRHIEDMAGRVEEATIAVTDDLATSRDIVVDVGAVTRGDRSCRK
jgi:hypothetical protein